LALRRQRRLPESQKLLFSRYRRLNLVPVRSLFDRFCMSRRFGTVLFIKCMEKSKREASRSVWAPQQASSIGGFESRSAVRNVAEQSYHEPRGFLATPGVMATMGVYPMWVWASRRITQLVGGARAGTGGDSPNDEASLTQEGASNPSILKIVLSLFSASDLSLLDLSLAPQFKFSNCLLRHFPKGDVNRRFACSCLSSCLSPQLPVMAKQLAFLL